jgi:hypothetical protein
MIMVASFHTTASDGETDQGKSPEQAAADLIHELRQKGIPAYTHAIENDSTPFTVLNRSNEPVRRKNLRKVRSLCVIAGNYPSFEDKTAQKTLDWIKTYEAKSLQDGVTYAPTPARPRPLSGAFLTINPLLSPEEVAARRPTDPLLRRLNSGVRHSLIDNPGEYTLVVAHFAGKTFTGTERQSSALEFLKDDDLDIAGEQANELASALRQRLDDTGRFNNLDAYVWHDRTSSVVTVGSFSSRNDPAIAHYVKRFAAERDTKTGKTDFKFLAIKDPTTPKTWAFIPTPQLMPVPKVR